MPRPAGHGFVDLLRERLDATVELLGLAGTCDVLVEGVPTPDQLGKLVEPGTLIIPYAGVPSRTRTLLRDHPAVSVHNLHHNAAPTAELAVALLLAAAKRILPFDRALRSGDWTPRYSGERYLLCEEKTALVLGYGAIGRRVAAACRGLGMRTQAVRRRGPLEGAPDEVFAPDALPELLPQAHALIVCLPWTPATDGLLGDEELALLPDGAVLVNIARGPIVQEEPLYEALRAERIAAGLDVWYRYPESESARTQTPPSAFPLHELDNVVFSPHRAGHTERSEELRATHLAELLNTAARGETLPNRVDLDEGY
jgi:phosphoglycerate dehydrogenase-like enzyme